jgi:hypothetical protein
MTFNAGATREVSHAGSSIHISSRAGAHLNGLSRGGDAHMRRTGLLGAGVAAKQHTPHGVRAARPFPRCHNKSSSDGSPPPVESNGAASPHPGRSGSGLVSATDRSNDCAANRPISIDGKSGNDYGVLSRGQGGLQKCFLFSASQHRLRLHCITSLSGASGPSAYVRCLLQQPCVVSPTPRQFCSLLDRSASAVSDNLGGIRDRHSHGFVTHLAKFECPSDPAPKAFSVLSWHRAPPGTDTTHRKVHGHGKAETCLVVLLSLFVWVQLS